MRAPAIGLLAALAVVLTTGQDAQAQPNTGVTALPGSPRMESRYDIYVGGLHGAQAVAVNATDGERYFTGIDIEVVGLPRLFTDLRWRIHGLAQIDGTRVLPGRYVHQRHRRGEWRTTVTDFSTAPPSQSFDPPRDYRADQLVPPDRIARAYDPLAGVLQTAILLGDSGECVAEAEVVEGRKLFRATVTDGGMEELPRSRRSMFHGPARRCDFTLVPEAGAFDAEEWESERGRGSVWLARLVDGMPPVPVRMRFERDGGSAYIHLQHLTASNGAVVSLP